MTVRGWGKRAAIAAFLILPFLIDLRTVQAKIVVPSSGSVIEVDEATLKAVVDIFEDAEDLEEGTWRIRGNVGESSRVLPFGTAPHPLF